jgi:hypothetical protein
MRNLLLFVLALAVLCVLPSAKAQEQPDKVEIFGGYTYTRFNINAYVSGFPPSSTYIGNGGGGNLEYNANRWLGLVGDFTGYYVGTTSTAYGGAFSYMFGPRVNFRRGRVTPFVQTLFGGIVTTSGIGQPGPVNSFAMTAGGGVDFKVSRHFAIRPVQAEYFLTKISDGLNNRQNNSRFSAGVVFRFGEK